jgi:sulfur-carrier protein
MTVSVRIPSGLRSLTDGKSVVEAQGRTVAEVMANLEDRFPGLRGRVCGDDACQQRLVNIYLQGEDIKYLSGMETELQDGNQLMLIPAAAGG